ncbi:hypothetical protein JCM10207_007495 [Rhodosporidiobolus poonsookiae]
MLKAKAKAAATAAAAKRKAAAAAAAAQEAAAQQAQQAAMGIQSTTRSGRGIRPNVPQYWADSNASRLAPGGSIQRIAYDQAAYEEAIRVVVFGEAPAEGSAAAGAVGVIEGKGKGVREELKESEEDEAAVLDGEGGAGGPPVEGDVAVLISAFDISKAQASKALRRHNGDLEAALRDLSTPQMGAAA